MVAVHRIEAEGLEVDHLFLDRAFNAFQSAAQGKRLTSFAAEDDKGRIAAALTLAGFDGVWTSPITGAFGGVAAAGPLKAGMVFALVKTASEWLRGEAGGRGATIRLAPDCFADPNRAALENALFRAGWSLVQVDLNYHRPVMSAEAFAHSLGETKRQELRRLKASGAAVQTISPVEAQEVYDVIAENHAARGFPMGMSWDQVRALGEAFPERLDFRAVRRGEDILAGALVLRITRRYRYIFNWGERPAFRKEFPITLLAEGLMAEAHADGVVTLDFGIATDSSTPNPGLIGFKELLGCEATAKRTYGLDLGV